MLIIILEFPPQSFSQPVDIVDPWIGPETYAEDFYSGGDVREGVLDPTIVGPSDTPVDAERGPSPPKHENVAELPLEGDILRVDETEEQTVEASPPPISRQSTPQATENQNIDDIAAIEQHADEHDDQGILNDV